MLDYSSIKEKISNRVITYNDVPIPSFIEINPTHLCNRKCDFCPRGHGWKDDGTHMLPKQAKHIHDELNEIGFEGWICICGFGEPCMNPYLSDIINSLKNKNWIVELVTNGDYLTREIAELCDYVSISLYEDEQQIEKFINMLDGLNFSIREYWKPFPTVTNRTGYVNFGREVDVTTPCNYTMYYMHISHNGNVYSCPQDWSGKYSMGNIYNQKLLDIWTGKEYQKYRKELFFSRTISPCNNCNACGTVRGNEHRNAWLNLPTI